jgi:hypothetical protein
MSTYFNSFSLNINEGYGISILEVIFMAKLTTDKRSFTLTMNKETYEEVAKIAARERRSVNFILNEYIEAGIKNDAK